MREDLNYSNYQKTIVYTYDSRGNVKKIKTYDYTRGNVEELQDITRLDLEYTDEVWLDEIDNTGDFAFVYDENGNPISYDNINFTWTNGRQLADVSVDMDNQTYPVLSYTYDDEGIRTEKTAWNTTTYYTTEGGNITSQYELDSQGGKQNEILFVYEGDDIIAAIVGGSRYYYEKNAMGDVIAVRKENGDELVSYRYDAWGNIVQRTLGDNLTTDEQHFAEGNPILYRSYYFDDEGLGTYYLQSRYYEASFSRFLNADIPDIARESKDEVNGQNLFAYCNNDPVNHTDPTGYNKLCRKIEVRLAYGVFGHLDVMLGKKLFTYGANIRDYTELDKKGNHKPANFMWIVKKRYLAILNSKSYEILTINLTKKEYRKFIKFYKKIIKKSTRVNESTGSPLYGIKKKLFKINNTWFKKYNAVFANRATFVLAAFLMAMPFKTLSVLGIKKILRSLSISLVPSILLTYKTIALLLNQLPIFTPKEVYDYLKKLKKTYKR